MGVGGAKPSRGANSSSGAKPRKYGMWTLIEKFVKMTKKNKLKILGGQMLFRGQVVLVVAPL